MFFGASLVSSSESKQTGNTTKSWNRTDAANIFKLLKTDMLYSLPIAMGMHWILSWKILVDISQEVIKLVKDYPQWQTNVKALITQQQGSWCCIK